MAVGAHVVPVLLNTGPVQRVIWRNVFVGILMKPALTACRLRSRVPGIGQRLQASPRELDQVLLQLIFLCILQSQEQELQNIEAA